MNELRQWRFIDTGSGSAGWNMAVDEALLEGYGEGDLPILRLYGWEMALSAGRFSDLSKNLDLERLEASNIACVRRMSGGGILVHGGDLSYTLIVPREPLTVLGVKESYRYLCRFLLRLYETLGQEPCFAAEVQKTSTRSDICLAGNEPYDILIGGKKMGGNAQRHTRHTLLQHGTVPIRLDGARFDPLFIGDSGLERAVSLEQMGCDIEYESLVQKMRTAFEETYGAVLVNTSLNREEEDRAEELLALKYTQKRWNRYGEH